MPFQYPYPQGQQGHVPYQPRQVPYYYEDLQHSSPTPSWPAYQRPTNSVVETKYLMKKNGPMGTSGQASAAASFFAKAHQRLQMNNEKKCIQNSETTEQSEEQFPTNFKAIVHRSPPQIPNHILRKLAGVRIKSLSSGANLRTSCAIQRRTSSASIVIP